MEIKLGSWNPIEDKLFYVGPWWSVYNVYEYRTIYIAWIRIKQRRIIIKK